MCGQSDSGLHVPWPPAERADLRRTDMSMDKLLEPAVHTASKHKDGRARGDYDGLLELHRR